MNEKEITPDTVTDTTETEMLCNACGAVLSASALFCPKCGRKVEPVSTPSANVSCIRCGAILPSGTSFCPSCGQSQVPVASPQPAVCLNCGMTLTPGAVFCPGCGTNTNTSATAKADTPKKRKRSKKWLIIGIIAAVLVIVAVIGVIVGSTSSGDSSSSGTSATKSTSPVSKLNSAYSTYCTSTWATLGTDYLSIDTNPNNLDDYINTDAYNAVKKVNTYLGLPSYLTDEMGKTTAMMGRQTENFSDVGISVSWSYHPDNGLEVIYKVIK